MLLPLVELYGLDRVQAAWEQTPFEYPLSWATDIREVLKLAQVIEGNQ